MTVVETGLGSQPPVRDGIPVGLDHGEVGPFGMGKGRSPGGPPYPSRPELVDCRDCVLKCGIVRWLPRNGPLLHGYEQRRKFGRPRRLIAVEGSTRTGFAPACCVDYWPELKQMYMSREVVRFCLAVSWGLEQAGLARFYLSTPYATS